MPADDNAGKYKIQKGGFGYCKLILRGKTVSATITSGLLVDCIQGNASEHMAWKKRKNYWKEVWYFENKCSDITLLGTVLFRLQSHIELCSLYYIYKAAKQLPLHLDYWWIVIAHIYIRMMQFKPQH